MTRNRPAPRSAEPPRGGTARVIGIGQPAAGDDGVGFAVIEALRRLELPADVELLCVTDPVQLIPLLESTDPLILVDAALGPAPGKVLVVGGGELDSAVRPLSSHGFSVADTLRLAATLWPEASSPSVQIVAIGIDPPERGRVGLSQAVAAAVPEAAGAVLQLIAQHRKRRKARASQASNDVRDKSAAPNFLTTRCQPGSVDPHDIGPIAEYPAEAPRCPRPGAPVQAAGFV